MTLHDGSHLLLKRIENDYTPNDRVHAIEKLHRSASEGHLLTGIFYVESEKPNFLDLLDLTSTPLAQLPIEKLRPPKSALDEVMEELT